MTASERDEMDRLLELWTVTPDGPARAHLREQIEAQPGGSGRLADLADAQGLLDREGAVFRAGLQSAGPEDSVPVLSASGTRGPRSLSPLWAWGLVAAAALLLVVSIVANLAGAGGTSEGGGGIDAGSGTLNGSTGLRVRLEDDTLRWEPLPGVVRHVVRVVDTEGRVHVGPIELDASASEWKMDAATEELLASGSSLRVLLEALGDDDEPLGTARVPLVRER